MADIHVLAGDGFIRWTLVFHFTVPDQNNNVNVNYRTALINSGLGGTSQMTEGTGPGQITTAELANIQSGALYEHSISFLAESGATTDAQVWAAAQAECIACETPTLDRLKERLKYYGKAGSKE